MRFLKILAPVCFACISTAALAQFSQPWSGNMKGFTTRIPNCSTPFGSPGMALDDFISPTTANLTKLVYWCNVSTPAQLNKPVHIAIYPNQPGACFPDFTVTVYSACVVPSVTQLVGTDCLGRKVWRCRVLLPGGGATVVPGSQYWLQISEDDSSSINVGVDDFKWCGHLGNVLCNAFQIAPTGVTVNPLTGCGGVCDLAFRIL